MMLVDKIESSALPPVLAIDFGAGRLGSVWFLCARNFLVRFLVRAAVVRSGQTSRKQNAKQRR